ncbi:hypothetical protein M885DRAFT_506457 [Pelagophyceae sp. CCMP2097]|nr:hypothetical protein M885DRAFT_506457 [Pelagophyceae sp. CCMP2097]
MGRKSPAEPLRRAWTLRAGLCALLVGAGFFANGGIFVRLHLGRDAAARAVDGREQPQADAALQRPGFVTPGAGPAARQPPAPGFAQATAASPPAAAGHRRRIVNVVLDQPLNATARRPQLANDDAAGRQIPCAAPLLKRVKGKAGAADDFSGIKVLVTGLSRSGSTWQYNVVKMVLQRVADGAAARGWVPQGPDDDRFKVHSAHADADSPEFDECLSHRICVLKTHVFVPRLLSRVDVILSSHRDLRDVVLSSMLMFGACFQPVGATKTMRQHGVAVRFQHYAHWAPYVCYDMVYEDMMRNDTREVSRVAAAVLAGAPRELVSAVGASDVAAAVGALSKKTPAKCVQTSARRKPRECWDAASGFAASHVHKTTSQPAAWAKSRVVDEVQRRVPGCDAYVAIKRVEQGFGGWLKAHGYALDDAALEDDGLPESGDGAPESGQGGAARRRLAASSYEGNWFVESLPERDYLMDAALALPRQGTPALYPRFVHVVNPYARSAPHASTTISGRRVDEDALVHYSLMRAWRVAQWSGVDVELVAAMLDDDDHFSDLAERWPTRRACALKNRVEAANGMKLPLIRDLLACADANAQGADWVILTNPDIVVHPHFYAHISQLVRDERRPFRTAWSITRRQVAPRAFADMADVFKAKGDAHLGHDTFVVPREWLERLDMANLVPGFSPWGGAFMTSLAHLGRAVVLGDKRWTFHLAEDGAAEAVAAADAADAAAAPDAAAHRAAQRREQALQKRADVCDNAPGTLYNTREAAKALSKTLGEPISQRCCCDAASGSAPHATARLPRPDATRALDLIASSKRPQVKALGLAAYEYIWDRVGAEPTLSRCAALPGIQLLPPGELRGVVSAWCAANNVKCAPSGPDCTRARHRPTFADDLRDDVAVDGAPLTVLLVYEKLPTQYEGGHVRVRQLATWLCHAGHRVLLAHRGGGSARTNASFVAAPGGAEALGIDGCTAENLAVFALDERMTAMTPAALAKQRVDVALLTLWFYRTNVPAIPDIALEALRRAGELRKRRLRVVILSDDVQNVRARAVGAGRGDAPGYWEYVRGRERALYAAPAVDAVVAISADDAEQFSKLGGAGVPPIFVLPFRARIDTKTVKDGWATHAASFAKRQDFVFVGGGTFANKNAVKWLLRDAVGALRRLADANGGCPALRSVRMIVAGSDAWAAEAAAACADATLRSDAAAAFLCPAAGAPKKRRGGHSSPGIEAFGRVADASKLLRQARLFVAPADVPSGISTKVWLALEHGLPIATSTEGGRGLPADVRAALAAGAGPFVLIPRNGTDAARIFAERAARVYCDEGRWAKAALASLAVAKRLEARAPWSTSMLADLVSTPLDLLCEPLPTLSAAVEDAHRTSLLDAVEGRFDELRARHATCLDLVKSSKFS